MAKLVVIFRKMSSVKSEYSEYIESYAWNALKKTKLLEQPYCECCWGNATTVHHLSYERRWCERKDDIVSICEDCHYECHHVNGYQIKNEEKTLKKRFEEVRESGWGDDSVEPAMGINDDYFTNTKIWEKLKYFDEDLRYSENDLFVDDTLNNFWTTLYSKIKWIDVRSLKKLNKNYFKDKNDIYYYDRNACQIWSFRNRGDFWCFFDETWRFTRFWIDIDSFVGFKKMPHYAKDRNFVYRDWFIILNDFQDMLYENPETYTIN